MNEKNPSEMKARTNSSSIAKLKTTLRTTIALLTVAILCGTIVVLISSMTTCILLDLTIFAYSIILANSEDFFNSFTALFYLTYPVRATLMQAIILMSLSSALIIAVIRRFW